MRITESVLVSMLTESRQDFSRESCGLLAGRDAAITAIFPARNVHPLPATAYEIAPKELFRLFREIHAQGLELLGIYHSHPSGENVPSLTDIERAYYPEAAYFIVSPALEARNFVRAFRIQNARVEELAIDLI